MLYICLFLQVLRGGPARLESGAAPLSRADIYHMYIYTKNKIHIYIIIKPLLIPFFGVKLCLVKLSLEDVVRFVDSS